MRARAKRMKNRLGSRFAQTKDVQVVQELSNKRSKYANTDANLKTYHDDSLSYVVAVSTDLVTLCEWSGRHLYVQSLLAQSKNALNGMLEHFARGYG